MSDGFQRNPGRRQDDATLQEKLDAALRELVATRAALRLTEIRLNMALGMPPEQLHRILTHIDSGRSI